MNKKTHPSIIKIWEQFTASDPSYREQERPSAFYFCDNEKDANECAVLVKQKIKQATAGSLWYYEKTKSPMPQIGEIYIVTDWNDIAHAIVQTRKITQVPFNKISAAFAKTEGEGDKSLAYWRRAHWAYFSREMAPYNEKPTEDMIIVCEEFETIFTYKNN